MVIRHVLLGSIGRFFRALTGYYAGAFPTWLVPVQVRLVSVADTFNTYCEDVAEQLCAENVRIKIDESDDRFGKKIRNATKDRVPPTLIVGGEDTEHGVVPFHYRGGEQRNGVKIFVAVQEVTETARSRKNYWNVC